MQCKGGYHALRRRKRTSRPATQRSFTRGTVIIAVNAGMIGAAQPCGGLDQCVEHGFQIKG